MSVHAELEETGDDYLPFYCDARDSIESAFAGYRFCPYCGRRFEPALIAALRETSEAAGAARPAASSSRPEPSSSGRPKIRFSYRYLPPIIDHLDR